MYVIGILVLQLVKVELYLTTLYSFVFPALGSSPLRLLWLLEEEKKLFKQVLIWILFFLCVAFNVKYLILSFFLIFLMS